MKDFKQLPVWPTSPQRTRTTYRATAAFPKDELSALIRKLRAEG
jgi:hypothetical protein